MPKKILLVDDSATIREHIRGVLEAAGYAIVEATNGREGLEAIGKHADLSLVLCDVHMPNMDGLEMVGAVKSNGQNAALPIIMLTAESDARVIARAKSAGVKGWIVKPVKPELLAATVRKVVGE